MHNSEWQTLNTYVLFWFCRIHIIVLPNIIIIIVKHFTENPNKQKLLFQLRTHRKQHKVEEKQKEKILAKIRYFFIFSFVHTVFMWKHFCIILSIESGFWVCFSNSSQRILPFFVCSCQNYYLPKSKFLLLIYLIFFVVRLFCITNTL